MSKVEIKIGIIGGTGLDQDSSILQDKKEVTLETTPFGDPSDKTIVSGKISGVTVYIMSRHGAKHNINPSNVNYRANIWSLKCLGVTHLLVTNAVGSLVKEIAPGTVAILDQYIDRTSGVRQCSFSSVAHIPQNFPFDRKLQTVLFDACKGIGITPPTKCTIIVMEGPRFSTLAESRLYHSWGAHCVGMTSVPEAQLAAEAGLLYASLALITDYDGWHEDDCEHVSVELVAKRMQGLGETAKKILAGAVDIIAQQDWTKDIEEKRAEAKAAIMFP